MIVCRFALISLASTMLAAGCKKPTVETYRVPKESIAQSPASPAPTSTGPAATGGTMASTPVTTASGPGLTWTAPAHWTAKPAGAMRKGSYAIKAEGIAGEADLSITAFPGDVGGELANVNRWRGQVQLPPISQADLAANTQHLDRNGLHLTVVDLAGTGAEAQRILGAIVPQGGATWFFKLSGPAAIVAKEKAAFTAFIDTIKPTPTTK